MTIHALGPFRLDTRGDVLLLGDQPLALGRRAVAVLRVLIEQRGAVVLKDALIEAVWPGQTVEESNLTVQIAALRRALAAVPGGERWIETMPRRGYRLVAPVAALDAAGIALPSTETVRAAAPDPRADAGRRQIAALSCELIGAPRRADGGDLEDLRLAIATFRRCVVETVSRYGGFVADHLGTTALVLFGYPAAHEHDVEQAVRAALALCATVSTQGSGALAALQCRVGIATGMAIIGDLTPSDADARREIVGDPPNLAHQIRMSAQPGGVAIDPDTRRLIGGLFNCRDLGTIATSGSEAVRIWMVLGESVRVSRFEALRGPALMRLVGREAETSLLLRLWSLAAGGAGQVALVAGEAGLGKSRLVVALEERLDTRTHFQLRYFCAPHRQDSPLFPFVDQLARAAGFGRDDTPAARLEKLCALLARADLRDEDVLFLADLLGLPPPEGQSLSNLSPARKKQRVLEALCRQLEGLSRQRPVLVIFEDAHWIDPTSRELLDIVVERARNLNVLVVVTFRPEFQPPWTGQSRVTTLALSRLDRRDRIALAVQVAGKPLPDAVIEQIADRTDGVPLFVEELTKSMLESGLLRSEADRYVIDRPLPELAIPSSLYASLLARLDRPDSANLVAQIGAVIGREFSYVLLRAVCDLSEDELKRALTRLVDSELVFQRGVPPAAVYSFKHALVRDASYDSLLRGSRRQWHARIGQALETQSRELTESQPEVLAWHYTEAGLAEKAVAFWAKAGRRSAARSALAEAAAQFQKALDQMALLPETVAILHQELEIRSAQGAVLRFLKGQAALETRQAYAHMRRLWEQLGSPPELRHVAYGLSMAYAYGGDLAEARHIGEELLRVSQERDDSAGLVLGHSVCGQHCFMSGELQAARLHLERLLAIYDPTVHDTLVQQAGSHPLMTQSFLAFTLCSLGWPDQALARSASAIADARRLAHPTSLAVGLALGALQASLVGDHATMEQRAGELATVSTEQGLPYYSAWSAIFRGRAKALNGDAEAGIALLREGLAAYRDTGAVIGLPPFIDLLAASCEAAGQTQEAVSLLDDVIPLTLQTGERWYTAELTRHKGQLLLRLGDTEGAANLFREALGIARQREARFWELRAAVSLARLYVEQGRPVEARDLLAPIYGWFTEGFGLSDLVEAKALLGSIEAISKHGERLADQLPGHDMPAPPVAEVPGGPSIAVLPFQNMSGDPEQQYFVDGMVEEITTALTRIRWLFVASRNSSFAYKGPAVDVQRVGRELGVRYVLEGSIRKAGDRVRITAQLIDAATGAHLWADRFDGSLDDVFELQDKVASNVAGVIEPTLQTAEMARSANRPTADLTAYDLYMRAYALVWSSSWQIPEALRLMEQAIERDPHYGPALAWAAGCVQRLIHDQRSADPAADARKGVAYARRALEVAGDDPVIIVNAAMALAALGEDIDAMAALVDRALALNPNFARGWHVSAVVRNWAGQSDIAIAHAETALRLSPRARVGLSSFTIGAAHFFQRRFAEAEAKLRLAIQQDEGLPAPYQFLAACYAHMGRMDDAREIVGRLRGICDFVIPDGAIWRDPAQRALYLSGLRMATGETVTESDDVAISASHDTVVTAESGLALPERPSVAVLPFLNLSGDPEQEYLADGMVEDITTELSRFRELFVIARTSAFTYKGKALGIRQIARELGVRYLLEGSVRRRTNDVRVTAQLIDAVSGAHLWAERYDRASSDIFTMQDEITASVAAVIEPTLARAERQRVLRKPPDRLDAWEAYQRGLWHFHKYGAEDNRIAQDFFQQAIALDPNFAPGHYGHALALYWDSWLYSKRPFHELERSEHAEARVAVSLDDKDATAHAVLAIMMCVAGDWEESVVEARIALALNPNSAFVTSTLGLVLGRAGYHEEGIRHLRQAMRASPHDPLTWQWLNGIGDFQLSSGAYEAALESYRQVIKLRPQFFAPHLFSAAALAYLGRSREAREALASAQAQFAEQIERRRHRPAWARPEDWAVKAEGLRLAAEGPA
jgi:TolB-like protein/DNA-binding winged helix-turn-helix (wHTH) protein/predicted ATPase/Tfp pilus assembly protein PilF